MSKLRLYGDTSGYIDVAAPATADNSTLDLSTVAKTTGATFTGQVSSTISSSTDPAGYFRNTSGSGDSPALVARGGANNNNAPTFQVEDFAGNVDFKVDGSGRVTMPNQPRFMITNGSNTNGWNGNFFIGGSTKHNVGNHFNTSTGIFTAPIAGYYQFYMCFSTSSANNHYMEIQYNGTGQYNAILAYTGTYSSASQTVTMYMATNDTTRLYHVYSGSNLYGTTFGGQLVG